MLLFRLSRYIYIYKSTWFLGEIHDLSWWNLDRGTGLGWKSSEGKLVKFQRARTKNVMGIPVIEENWWNIRTSNTNSIYSLFHDSKHDEYSKGLVIPHPLHFSSQSPFICTPLNVRPKYVVSAPTKPWFMGGVFDMRGMGLYTITMMTYPTSQQNGGIAWCGFYVAWVDMEKP